MSDSFCAFETVADDLLVDGLKKYLRTYHAEDLTTILESEQTEANFSINVNVLDLLQASNRIGSLLLAYPTTILPLFDKAACVAMEDYLQEHKSMLLSYKSNLHIRLHSLPLCQETSKTSVSSIRSSDINKFISVAGTVIKTGPIKMLEYEKTFQCTKCRKNMVVKADIEQHYTLNKPTSCTATEDCAGKYFKPVEGTQVCRDYQEIKIQDKIAHLNVGSIPRSILAILEDDLVDLCKAGDDVLITGTVLRRWKPLKPDVRSSIEMIVHCNHIRINNEQKSNVNVTQELENEFKEFWNHHRKKPLKARNLILKSMCPQLYGLYFVKLAVALTLIGGVPMIKNGTRIRGESHLLIVGDPGTGKSQFLKYASRLSPRYVMTNGIGTTSAGLTVMATKESGGDWTLEAGALVLADGGVCCIDEFDAIREHDRTTIHEAMEQQTLSIAKAGLVCKLNTRTTIFAACNPKGKYDLTASLSINCALASPLLSRFDVVLVLLDQKDDDWDKQVSRFILDESEILPDETDDHLWTVEKMQAYISYVKSAFKPTIPPASGAILNRYYLKQRDRDQRVAARTTIRLLESLVRLAQAHARLMFRTAVTEQDAIMAVLTVDTSMHTSTILNIESVLHSTFPDDPDAEYEEHRWTVLKALGLLDVEPQRGPTQRTQRPLLSQRLAMQDNMFDDEEEEEEEVQKDNNNFEFEESEDEDEENFAIEPPAKKQRTEPSQKKHIHIPMNSQKKSHKTQKIANQMAIPDLDFDSNPSQDEEEQDDEPPVVTNKPSTSKNSDSTISKQVQKLATIDKPHYPPTSFAKKKLEEKESSQKKQTIMDDDDDDWNLEQEFVNDEEPEPVPPTPPVTSTSKQKETITPSTANTPKTPTVSQQQQQKPKKTTTFVTPAPPTTRSKQPDNSTIKNNKSNNEIENSTRKSTSTTSSGKKRNLAQLLMGSQPAEEDQPSDEMNPEDEVAMLFGEMFDEPATTNTGSASLNGGVTVRRKYF
jgi:DNA helicase MCM9